MGSVGAEFVTLGGLEGQAPAGRREKTGTGIEIEQEGGCWTRIRSCGWLGVKESGTGSPLPSTLQGSGSRQREDRLWPPGHGRRRGIGGHCDPSTLSNRHKGTFVYIRVLGRYPAQDRLDARVIGYSQVIGRKHISRFLL
jgi:hypothetical protein